MEILFENDDLIAVCKPVGVLSEESGNKKSMPLLLREDARARGLKDVEFFTVHRLDREVGGAMIFAKNSRSAALLSEAIRERRMIKEYLAVVKGVPEEEGVLEDLLFRDSRSMKTFVVKRMRAGVRPAKLSYVRVGTAENGADTLSLVRVKLATGRTHQIRVQFASRGMPLYGDGRYGSGDGKDAPALFSVRIALPGVFDVQTLPSSFPFTLFGVDGRK